MAAIEKHSRQPSSPSRRTKATPEGPPATRSASAGAGANQALIGSRRPKARPSGPGLELVAPLADPLIPPWVLLPLRLFLGITFVYAGVQKLTDPQYFRPSAPGYIGRQIAAFATGTPLHGLLTGVALPHAIFFGTLVAWGELAIGLGTLMGLLLRPAAFFGLAINAIFFLSATWRVHPYFYGSDIVFIFGWLTLLLAGAEGTGGLALDCWLAPELVARIAPERRITAGHGLALLLGIGSLWLAPSASGDSMESEPRTLTKTGTTLSARSVVPAAAAHARGGGHLSRPARTHGRETQMPARGRRARYSVGQKSSRRDFLWGLASGAVGTLLVGVLGRWWTGSRDDTGGNSGLEGGVPAATTTSSTAAGGSSGTGVIAQASAVADNSAVSFTLPSNGDLGVLVRLGNGQFVAYDATCTHAGCPVQYDPGSGLLICPCHGAEFDPAHAAAVVQGPAATPLASVPINVSSQNGDITLAQ
jgi:thiosulfate dehydrogenase (quinone) large subunit